MALRNPPSWLQNGSHPAENDRLSMQGIIATSGTFTASSLEVTQAASPAMSVQVASGWGAIVGDYTTNMGVYQFYNDAATSLSVATADPSNPRIDKVVVTVNDAYYTGAVNNVTFQVLTGTPAVSPAAPATPTNSLVLATIAVAAGATSIVNANITDARVLITTNLPVGDITAVTAGTGLSGGGSSGSVTLSIASAQSDLVIKGFEEDVNVVASAATGTINFDVATASVWYYTSNASANHTLNFRYDSSNTLNSKLAVGDAITLVWLNTNGSTAYYPNVIQIDGSAVTPKVPAAISAGNASAIDAYVFTIIKTAATPTYTVLETQTKFA